ncbi:MAG: low molecular weight protein-tyrosine-phosphatase [Gammaproteobacteria bacterium]|nr:MAG: low molecular weight protein-tyrosine-phosphatase [Gammaproteobacteria bacterium]
MFNILFVCMGNICRSPSAEGFFARQLQGSSCQDLVSIDSAGTHSYHIGHAPDPRAIETGAQFGVQIDQLRARKVTAADFRHFDLIIAMDHSNLVDLQAIRPSGSMAELQLMMAYHPENHADGQANDVPDPYYGGIAGFVHMFKLLELATAGLLKDVEGRFKQDP